MLEINREIMTKELKQFIERIFKLPEISAVQVRNIVLHRDENSEDRENKLQQIIEKSYHDCYSDVDLSIRVKHNPKDAITQEEYVKCIDRFGITSENCLGLAFVKENSMYRIILKNGMRYDFGIGFEEDEAADMIQLSTRNAEEYNNPSWPLENINRFWFVQIQALGKLYRKDFLIADHLANMNLNETLVQQMVLRDLKYGTNHHRYGYEEDLTYLNYQGECSIHTDNPIFHMIADKIYCAALTYDSLVKAFYPEAKGRSREFFEIWKCYEQNRS